jgi:hypothetical protein
MCAQVITTPVPLDERWHTAWALVKRSFRSSLHYVFASVNADGTPHVTPIGSLLLKGANGSDGPGGSRGISCSGATCASFVKFISTASSLSAWEP